MLLKQYKCCYVYVFKKCSLSHLIAGVKKDNIASIQLLEQLKMKFSSTSESYTYIKKII